MLPVFVRDIQPDIPSDCLSKYWQMEPICILGN
jgi:hypothetical protein